MNKDQAEWQRLQSLEVGDHWASSTSILKNSVSDIFFSMKTKMANIYFSGMSVLKLETLMTGIKLWLSFYGWMTWMRPRSVPFLTLVRPWGHHQTPDDDDDSAAAGADDANTFLPRGLQCHDWTNLGPKLQNANCSSTISSYYVLHALMGDWNDQWPTSTYTKCHSGKLCRKHHKQGVWPELMN